MPSNPPSRGDLERTLRELDAVLTRLSEIFRASLQSGPPDWPDGPGRRRVG